ncbi:ParA family protein [Candidatus Palauibacter sp.]|uniref:ParA family protein n=1 Tax=Candidatus Palauibacter sp. TaxID=3101350 RepID=UPI003B0157A1
MTAPVLTFFNNKGGVGKTSLVYHLAWMFSELDRRVLAVDLDPQANLTAAFLPEEIVERLWRDDSGEKTDTMAQCIAPLAQVGDIRQPNLQHLSDTLSLIPGDLALSGFEDLLSAEWPNCLGSRNMYRPFRVVTAFWQVLQWGAERCDADIILVDVGPSLGAINRSALIATDFVVVPLGADLFSRQGLRNLGPTLRRWRDEWNKRVTNWNEPEFPLPKGSMEPLGYLIQQHGVRLSRPVRAYDRWAKRMPAEYARSVLEESPADVAPNAESDANCIATIKHYRSLVPLGQDARKPIFKLSPADGAIGSHAVAAAEAFKDFKELADEIARRFDRRTSA